MLVERSSSYMYVLAKDSTKIFWCSFLAGLSLFKFTEIIFIDHQTGDKKYFKRSDLVSIAASGRWLNAGDANGLWVGVGVDNAYSYQLLICDDPFFSGFFISGYTDNCFKLCNSWCGDRASPYFRTASSDPYYKGVAFNTNGHHPNVMSNRLMSAGLR